MPSDDTSPAAATDAGSTWTAVPGAGPPAERLELDDLSLISEVAHPVRSRIIRRLKEPRTVAEIAGDLDVPVTRLYHHVNRLEDLDLIRVVATRQVAAVTERRYQVTATNFGLAPELIESEDPAEVAAALGSLFDIAKFGLQREIERGTFSASEGNSVLSLADLVLSSDRRRELVDRLKALIDEFTSDASDDDVDAARVALFISAIPQGD